MPVYVGVTPVGTVGDAYSASPDGPIQRTVGTGTELFDVLTNDSASGPKTLLSVTAVSPLLPTQVAISGTQVQLTKTGLGAATYFVDYLGALASNHAVQGAARLEIELKSTTATYTANPDGPVPSLVGAGTVDVPVLPNDTTVPVGVAKVILDVAAVSPLTDAKLNIVGDAVRVTKTGLAAGTYAFDYTGAQDANRAVRGTARGTLTLTSSSGSDPFGVVRVYPMRIASAASADITRPAFDGSLGATNTVTLAAGKYCDWRGREGQQHKDGSPSETCFAIKGGEGATWSGGITRAVSNSNYTLPWRIVHGPSAPWSGSKNDKGLNSGDPIGGTNYCEGFFFDGAGMDGFGPPSDFQATHHTTNYTNIRMDFVRDDCWQNDQYYPLSVYNFYGNGHAILSQRQGKSSPPWLKVVSSFENCIFHMRRMPYTADDGNTDQGASSSKRAGPYNGPSDRGSKILTGISTLGYAHKWFFKMSGISGGFYRLRLKMKNCLLRIDTLPVEGAKIALFPPIDNSTGNGSSYENVTVLWFGGAGGVGATWNNTFTQSKTFLANWGITVLEADTDANESDLWNKWVSTETYWLQQNGWIASSRTFDWNRP